jgi:hypothetical protein
MYVEIQRTAEAPNDDDGATARPARQAGTQTMTSVPRAVARVIDMNQ